MIHSAKNIIYLLVGLLTCMACSDESLINGGEEAVEGVPVTATFSFNTSDPTKVETKATDINESNTVKSLAIYIFKKKKDGTFVRDAEPKICTSAEIESKSISIATTSGSRYVYAIANYKSSLYAISEEQLRSVTTIDDLKNMSVTLPDNTNGSSISVLDGVFLMSGCVAAKGDNVDFDTPCTISTDGAVSGKIYLQHVMSSIQFKVKSVSENATFVADSWQVKNVPQSSYVFKRSSNSYVENEKWVFRDSKESSVFEKQVKASLADQTYNFSFLMMENRKTASSPISSFDMREKMTTKAENFINAPENSTYVILKGTYTGYTDETINGDGKQDKNVTAYTTYYIHLGDWNSKTSGGEADYADFNIFRSIRYIYTVKVAAVDKLIVEVETDNQEKEAWGSDGEMYVTSSNIEFFDAHYGTTVISFHKQMIADLIKQYTDDVGQECDEALFVNKFPIIGTSPRGNFQPSSELKDLDWVTFKRNPAGEKGFVKYKEGDYDEPLNVNGFKADLFNACKRNEGFGADDSIRYTCFIDEYFYGDKNGNYPGNTVPLKLQDFINQQPRTINILTYYKANTEPTSNSFINMSTYAFVQRSIYTIYDLDRVENNNVNGWGTESIQETENLKSKQIETVENMDNWKNDFNQGRENMKKWIAKIKNGENKNTWNPSDWKWDELIDYTTNQLAADYNYAQYACLAKNRDLNGNGQIDDNEIRWYLPAINQYTALVIGNDVLPEDVRLYRQTDKDILSGYSYVGSTVNANPTIKTDRGEDFKALDYYVLLAAEGLSISYKKDNRNSYRCVRNLRNVTSKINDIAIADNGYYDSDGIGKSFTFKNLNPRAKRDNIYGALTFGHNSLDEENRLPNAFEVREKMEYKDITASQANMENPCKDADQGWRLPNQKELAIIVFHRAGDSGQAFDSYFSCTKNAFATDSYCGYNGDSNGIQSMTLWKGGYTFTNPFFEGYIDKSNFRCVRDKTIK